MVYGTGLENQRCESIRGFKSHPLRVRGVAQFGRALALGASGRRFKSFHPDLYTYSNYEILLCGILARELGNTDGKSGEWRDNRCGKR